MQLEFSGLGITQMRGRLVDTTIGRNHYGAYAKTALYGHGFTFGQYWLTYFNDALSAAWSLWQTLDHEIQEEWNRAALQYNHTNVFGNKHRMRGVDFFNKQTAGIFTCGEIPTLLPVLDKPVIGPTFLTVDTLTPTALLFNLKWTNNSVSVPNDVRLFFCASACVPAGRTRLYSGINIVEALDPGTAAGPYDVTGSYNFFRGSLVTGKKVFMRAFAVNIYSGMRSPEVTTVGTVS